MLVGLFQLNKKGKLAACPTFKTDKLAAYPTRVACPAGPQNVKIAHFLRSCRRLGFEVSSRPISTVRRTWPFGYRLCPECLARSPYNFADRIPMRFHASIKTQFQAADRCRTGVFPGGPVRFLRDADSSRPVRTAELGHPGSVDCDSRRPGRAGVCHSGRRGVCRRLRGRRDLFAWAAGQSVFSAAGSLPAPHRARILLRREGCHRPRTLRPAAPVRAIRRFAAVRAS